MHRLLIGSWNQMSVYDDHIRLWNEGMLPEGYTVETLMGKHTSRPRNPKIAQVFYRAGFIEAWGRGYEKINKAFDTANLKRPTFLSEQGGISAIIPREIFMAIRQGTDKNGESIETASSRTETEQKPNRNRTETKQKPNRRKQKEQIVELMLANSTITRGELSEILNLHESSVQRRIDSLVKDGRIRRIGSDSNGQWIVNEN